MKKLLFVFSFLMLVVMISGCTTGADVPNANDIAGEDNSDYDSENTSSEVQTDSGVEPVVVDQTTELAVQVSAEELNKHNSETDCWVSFRGDVFDITTYLPEHPGSAEAISPYCGTSTQFEDAFLTKHGESKIKGLLAKGIFKGNLAN